MNELTYDDLKAIQFALSFTYWLHKATMHKPANLDVIQGKVWRMVEAAAAAEDAGAMAKLRHYGLVKA